MQSEVILLGQLKHPNPVKLIGYCCEEEEIVLIYEFMPRDFGLATMGPEGSKSHVTTRVMGTYGYAAPENVSPAVVSDALWTRGSPVNTRSRRIRIQLFSPYNV
ncbi:unnamed protein product [Brassica oleracea var. botrytis]